jgi:multiple sugar transport system permease protein
MSVSGGVRALRPPARESEPGRRRAGTFRQRQMSGTSRLITLAVLLLATLYFLLPIWWLIVSATKTNPALFSSDGFWFSGMALADNVRDVFSFEGSPYARWLLNSAIYAGAGGVGATFLGLSCGYGLAKFQFRGRGLIFAMIMSGILIPSALLTVPLYLMFSAIHLVGTYWSVIIPSIVSPFAVYLGRVYAAESVPDEILEAARIDGAGEIRIFATIVTRIMSPAIVTIFLFSFVFVWNNFFLALVMLSNENLYPVTLGLYTWFAQRSVTTYNVVITGSLISILPLIVAFASLGRFWRNGIVAGSIKG